MQAKPVINRPHCDCLVLIAIRHKKHLFGPTRCALSHKVWRRENDPIATREPANRKVKNAKVRFCKCGMGIAVRFAEEGVQEHGNGGKEEMKVG